MNLTITVENQDQLEKVVRLIERGEGGVDFTFQLTSSECSDFDGEYGATGKPFLKPHAPTTIAQKIVNAVAMDNEPARSILIGAYNAKHLIPSGDLKADADNANEYLRNYEAY